MYIEIAKIYGKNESSICEIVKLKKKIHATFAVILQNTINMAIVHNKCLVKMQKTFNL